MQDRLITTVILILLSVVGYFVLFPVNVVDVVTTKVVEESASGLYNSTKWLTDLTGDLLGDTEEEKKVRLWSVFDVFGNGVL